jgi:D-glycero-alpha-D-manno-heptose-7-phosphate kinase
MIITRSPLRVSIGGGGTDLPSYYREHGGFLLAMAIQKHVYVSLQTTLEPGLLLKYSSLERVLSVDEIRHPIIRECLLETELTEPQLEITSVADIPAGTGLGSSGSFTTALLKAIYIMQRRHIDPGALAELACRIEIDRVGEPIGKQDQYIAAYGGLTAFTFEPDGTVQAESLRVTSEIFDVLHENTLMFFTGKTRATSAILREQDVKSKNGDTGMADNLHLIKALGHETRTAFLRGDLGRWGEIMGQHWEAKKRRSPEMSNPQIDEWYALGLKNGAIGGKLVGAGGGGFLLFYTEDPRRLRSAFQKIGLPEVRLNVDVEGTKVISR